jgi:hypothetical protein
MAFWDWLTGGSGSGSGSGSVGGYDESMLPGAGTNYAASTAAQDASALSNLSGGGMNWAGLSSGLSNLSKSLGSSGSSSSNTLQTSPSVSGTVSGGTLSPAGAGGGASALASADTARQQLAQYLILAAMQGKGRGSGGKGLLG